MNYKKLSDGTILRKEALNDDYSIIMTRTDTGNYRIKPSELSKYIRELPEFANVATLDGTESLSNKNLLNPSINHGDILDVSSDIINNLKGWDGYSGDINKLTGLPITRTELSRLEGVSGNIQDQLNAAGANVLDRLFSYYTVRQLNGGATLIPNSEIILNAGLSNQFYVSPETVMIQVFMGEGESFVSFGGMTDITVNYIYKTSIPANVLDVIKIAVNEPISEDIRIAMLYKVVRVPIPVPGA